MVFSVARQEEVGIVRCGVMAVPFLRYLVLLFSYCLKQFVYILIKRNESHSERVCFVVASGVVLAFSSQQVLVSSALLNGYKK